MNPPIRSRANPLPESGTELKADAYRPDEGTPFSEHPYQKATKDTTLSNITQFDLTICSFWNNITDGAKDMGMPELAKMHAYEQEYWLNLKRAVDGFTAKNNIKTSTEVTADYKGNAPINYNMTPP
jgi:hypothetical protein